MKKFAIFAGDQVFDGVAAPAATAHDVLTQVGLPGEYFLSTGNGLPFGETEVIYDKIRDGEKLHASSKATVGV